MRSIESIISKSVYHTCLKTSVKIFATIIHILPKRTGGTEVGQALCPRGNFVATTISIAIFHDIQLCSLQIGADAGRIELCQIGATLRLTLLAPEMVEASLYGR